MVLPSASWTCDASVSKMRCEPACETAPRPLACPGGSRRRAARSWLQFSFPNWYHYDVLRGLAEAHDRLAAQHARHAKA